MKTKKVDGMILANFIVDTFYSSTYPFIHKEVMQYVTSSQVAILNIIDCLGVILYSWAWNKYGKTLYKFYPYFCMLETILTISTTTAYILTHNIVACYLVDSVVFTIITRNILCGTIRMKAARYPDSDSREKFDNRNNGYSSLATIIGSVIAIWLKLPYAIMLVIATVGNCIDNIAFTIIYYKMKKK